MGFNLSLALRTFPDEMVEGFLLFEKSFLLTIPELNLLIVHVPPFDLIAAADLNILSAPRPYPRVI